MPFCCFQCQGELDIIERPGRQETCPDCGADLHCCRNCRFYDRASYNECREPMAERVLEKEKANFCDYFEFLVQAAGQESPERDAKRRLTALFKKN